MFNNEDISIFSFFSGAGFLDLGFEMEKYNLAFVNEYHKPFINVHKYSRMRLGTNFPEFDYHESNVMNFIEESKDNSNLQQFINQKKKKGNIIGFIGGPPCPDFSVGGKNRGEDGENGKLTKTYIELICQKQPDFFLLENVKGLWKTKKHRAFYDEMKKKLNEQGYLLTDRLINVLEFGVPQKRERLMLFGININLLVELNSYIKTSEQLSEVFPWEATVKHKIKDLLDIDWPTYNKFEEDSIIEKPKMLPTDLTVEEWFKMNNVYSHENSAMFFKPRSALPRFRVISEGDDSRKSFKRLHRWRFSPTAAYGNNEVHLHPYKIRRLSVSEALAIQSLPKAFVLPEDITLTNAFKTIGNGVPFLAAQGIAKSISLFFQQIGLK